MSKYCFDSINLEQINRMLSNFVYACIFVLIRSRLGLFLVIFVIDKGCISEAFLFKSRGGRSLASGLNRKPRRNPLSSL